MQIRRLTLYCVAIYIYNEIVTHWKFSNDIANGCSVTRTYSNIIIYIDSPLCTFRLIECRCMRF
jgi:hypothetical protein